MPTEILPNPALRDLYREPERMNERADMIRLDRNERLSPFPREVFAEMMRPITAEVISTYPDPTPLYGRIARLTGLSEDSFFFTNGSDAALRMIMQSFLQPGDALGLTGPTYAMLSVYARILQPKVIEIPYDENIGLDLARVEQLIDQRPRAVIIPNPDQPTGTVIDRARLKALIARAEVAGVLFVIDEAYYPFYPYSAVEWVKDFPNLLVTRSFSKAWGLSGLRLGFMAGAPALVNCASRVRGLHEVNAIAAHVGCYLMDHPEIVVDYVREVDGGREELRRAAKEMGLGFPECHTNFQLLRCPGVDTGQVITAMKKRGYLIKGAFKAPGLRDCIRTTIGPAPLMRRFIGDLAAALQEQRR